MFSVRNKAAEVCEKQLRNMAEFPLHIPALLYATSYLFFLSRAFYFFLFFSLG